MKEALSCSGLTLGIGHSAKLGCERTNFHAVFGDEIGPGRLLSIGDQRDLAVDETDLISIVFRPERARSIWFFGFCVQYLRDICYGSYCIPISPKLTDWCRLSPKALQPPE